ncbi:hypothetical protein ROLI_008150 [Roseobacter fucihabitans]|uniref:Uncharacterized protein n=1 Tax=Roseobacter fucihabitans TaxID=1537242 RepID=A0ABZ2BP30_9RHOB|nr:hypothetical protein [Roseobacter litoralis]
MAHPIMRLGARLGAKRTGTSQGRWSFECADPMQINSEIYAKKRMVFTSK